MQPPTEIRSSNEKWKDAGQWARKATLAVWLSGFASVGLTWAQSRWHVFHPHYLPLLFLFFVLAVSTFFAIACCLWRIVRGPRRARATILAVVALLPAAFWANVGITAKTNWERRLVPNTLTMRLSKAMGATFIRAEADFEYRNRLETDRLVMYYGHLDHPEHDLEEMDRHLARLEDLLGGTISAKAHWIRGSLPRTGVGSLSVHGLSLGSDSSPEVIGHDIGQYRGDRHELAHAALDWFRLPSSDPPQVLNEGWAMAQCGDTTIELAQAAANAR